MNIQQMHNQCDLLLDKANSPWFSDNEKDDFLNEMIARFVENNHLQFELDERTRKKLLPLVKIYQGSNTDTINYNAINGYMFTLNLQGEFPKKCGSGTAWSKISPIQLDDEAETQNDPFNKNDDSNPGYIEYNNGTNDIAKIISDNPAVNYTLKYLEYPAKVVYDRNNSSNNVDCNLPDFTHEEIVRGAVAMMLANTEQQLNYQLNENEINKQE